jgi:hypothetical protein
VSLARNVFPELDARISFTFLLTRQHFARSVLHDQRAGFAGGRRILSSVSDLSIFLAASLKSGWIARASRYWRSNSADIIDAARGDMPGRAGGSECSVVTEEETMSHRSIRLLVWNLLVFAVPNFVLGQNLAVGDPQALSYAAKSIAAMTAGSAISDVRLTADVTWISGPELEPGTGVLSAKGATESRIDLALNSGGKRTEVRNSFDGPEGKWANPDGKSGKYALHNCWTDAAWFFPPLSSLVLLR